jgi:hypothetical protein
MQVALLEQERKFADLQAYRQQAVEQNRENIIPQLIDYVQGNTAEEINESVASFRQRSKLPFAAASAASEVVSTTYRLSCSSLISK